jgi:adenine phosphoribosyltransferase
VEAIDKMIQKLGSHTAGYAFVIELDDLHGKERLKNAPVRTIVHFEGE